MRCAHAPLQWFSMRVVVTGGTGFLGRPLTIALRAAGQEVTVLTRRANGRSAGREVEWQPTGAVGSWVSELDGADVVINLAGESLADGRWTAARKQHLRNSRLNATRSIVGAIGRARRRPATFISGSAVGYYGPRGSEPVTESEPAGTDFLGTLARDWEAAALEAQGLGVRVVLLRTGLVLERDGGALQRLLLPFRLGVGGPLGSGEQYWPWIHREDWIAIVAWLLTNQSVTGPINATAPMPETNASFSKALAATLGRPCLFRVPAAVLRLAMGEMAAVVLAGQRAVPAKLAGAKFSFAFPRLDNALAAILRDE
jgi:uncharacterized protein (TIGR01777 family)